jgi:hypothetical protein
VFAVSITGVARAAGVQIVRGDRAWAQWSGASGCVQWFVHVLAERSQVIDPPGTPAGAAVAWVSIVKADACSGALFESSTGHALTRGIRFDPRGASGGASLRATVPLTDAITATTRSVRVEVDWIVTDAAEAHWVAHDYGTVRIDATSSEADAHGSVLRSTGAVASGDAVAAGIMTFRRTAAGRDV